MRRLCLIALALSIVLLTACGGDQSAQNAPGSPENPLQGLPNPAPTRVPPTSEAAIRRGAKVVAIPSAQSPPSIIREQKRVQARNERAREKRAAKGGRSSGHAATAGSRRQVAPAPSARRPCSLVTRTQARAIIGAAILEPLEAPQGPTCIYQTPTGKPYITLTVQRASYARLQEQVRRRHSIAVADRRGVCGSYGRPMLYVPVGGGRVLSVAAPCAIASRFAARAIPHL
jgi:hypothetical protein